ncbi:MAG: hypothetical protein ACRELB_19950, partial [Polyangiaceae bacterium]
MPLRRFLSLLESGHDFGYPTPYLADGVGGAAVAAALSAHGVLAPAGEPTWYPCARGHPRCRRTVSLCADKLLAVCGR